MLKLSLIGLFVASMATLTLAASYLPVEPPVRPVAQAALTTQVG